MNDVNIELLRYYRKLRKLTLKELSMKLSELGDKKPLSAIGMYERELRKPDYIYLTELAMVLELEGPHVFYNNADVTEVIYKQQATPVERERIKQFDPQSKLDWTMSN